jgi:hypothetical protein
MDIKRDLEQERDRLNRLLRQVEEQKFWAGDTPGRENIPSHIKALKAAIDQIEVALRVAD